MPIESAVKPEPKPKPKRNYGYEFNRFVHGGSGPDPRDHIVAAAEKQYGRLPGYHSAVGESLYRKRFPQGVIQDTTGHARATRGQGKAYVPYQPDQNSFINKFGFYGVANHESEHAYNQDPKDPWTAKYPEISPSVGDIVFISEQYKNEFGEPLQHRVKFPGVSHDIGWMGDQAKRHGYWDGRSMEDLLRTKEGAQWLRLASGRMQDSDAPPGRIVDLARSVAPSADPSPPPDVKATVVPQSSVALGTMARAGDSPTTLPMGSTPQRSSLGSSPSVTGPTGTSTVGAGDLSPSLADVYRRSVGATSLLPQIPVSQPSQAGFHSGMLARAAANAGSVNFPMGSSPVRSSGDLSRGELLSSMASAAVDRNPPSSPTLAREPLARPMTSDEIRAGLYQEPLALSPAHSNYRPPAPRAVLESSPLTPVSIPVAARNHTAPIKPSAPLVRSIGSNAMPTTPASYPVDERDGKSRTRGTPMKTTWSHTPLMDQALAPVSQPARVVEPQGPVDPVQGAFQNYRNVRNLAAVGAPDYTDFNMKTGMQNIQRNADNRSLAQMNAHLSAGGGLQADGAALSGLYSTPYREYEGAMQQRMSGMAADRRDAANAKFDKGFQNYQAMQAANRVDADGDGVPDVVQDTYGKFGVKSIPQLAKMNAQYNMYMQAFRNQAPEGQRAMSFDEFLKNRQEAQKNMPVFGAAPAQGSGTAAPAPDPMAAIINQGRKAYREANQAPQPSEQRVAAARTQGDLMRAAAFARANGMNPIAAINAQARLNDEIGMRQRAYDAAQANIKAQGDAAANIAGINTASAERIASGNNTSAESIAGIRSEAEKTIAEKKIGDEAQARKDKSKFDNAELINNTMGELKPLQQNYEAKIQEVMSDERYQNMGYDQRVQLAQTLASQHVNQLAEQNRLRIGLLNSVGIDTAGMLDSYITLPSLSAPAAVPGGAAAPPLAGSAGPAIPQGIAALRPDLFPPATYQGQASPKDFVDMYRNAIASGNPMTAQQIQDTLRSRGKFIEPESIQALQSLARSKESGNEEARQLLKQLYGIDPNSTTYTLNQLFNSPWDYSENFSDGKFVPGGTSPADVQRRAAHLERLKRDYPHIYNK